VGGQEEITTNIRLLSATHKNLNKMVETGEFRQDLYYRINVIELITPPLRARISDIPEIAQHLLKKLAQENKQIKPTLTEAAIRALQHYHFPGNVRELENILERALALHEGHLIDTSDLNLPIIGELSSVEAFSPTDTSLELYLEQIEKDLLTKTLEENYGNKTATAKQLGLSLRSLHYRLKKLTLD